MSPLPRAVARSGRRAVGLDGGIPARAEEFLSVYVGNLSLSTSVFDIEKIFRRLEELNLMELLDGVTRRLEVSLALLSMKT